MKSHLTAVFIFATLFILCSNCDGDRFDDEVEIPDFDFPQSVSFESSLSAYNIFEGSPSDLIPTDEFELLELSSVLFTDYAHKQRLVKIPEGTIITQSNDGSLLFPDGTILTKTFYYYNDERDINLGKRIIETRLEIKENGIWNVATYIWNESQTEATLENNGTNALVSWTDNRGVIRSTNYHIPSQNECMTCHQSNAQLAPLGPSLLNLNREVIKNGTTLNQINYLQLQGLLENFPINEIPHMVNYKDTNESISDRGRAYLAMNCGHCHNPNAWDEPADQNFDFRYETSFSQTGISSEKNEILRNVTNQEMPFIGTTLLDEEGLNLLTEYLESL